MTRDIAILRAQVDRLSREATDPFVVKYLDQAEKALMLALVSARLKNISAINPLTV